MSNTNENEYVETAIHQLEEGIILSRDHIEGLRTDILDLVSAIKDTEAEIENAEEQITSLARQQIAMIEALDQLHELGEKKQEKADSDARWAEMIANAPDGEKPVRSLQKLIDQAPDA